MSDFDKDKYYQNLAKTFGEGWTNAEADELAQMLSTTVLRKALGQIVLEAQTNQRGAGMQNLWNEAGIKQAQQMQGLSNGMERAVEILLEAATPEQEPATEDEGES